MIKQRRKLIRKDILEEIAKKNTSGVPLSRLIRDYDLDISLPHITKLVNWYKSANKFDSVKASLFPEWLKNNGTPIQVQPWEKFRYLGTFPTGCWVRIYKTEVKL